MRLIDADMLPSAEVKGIRGIKFIPKDFIDIAPTVDAVPVRHGKWINDKGLYKCSVCNEFSIAGWANCIPIEQMNKTMKYCPNCGARMDAKDDDFFSYGERKE